MASLLNEKRPPVFCPGCSHDRVLQALDRAFRNMALQGHEIAMVSDIGCSGLFDTFFLTHALHGLHGRALTYAAGLKLARPELNVVVTMGDGGMGIGGAHLLAACRRNLDLTLLILNNFNFGMTGGQFSATTPPESTVASGFLNQLEQPLNAGEVLSAAGASLVTRCSAYDKRLSGYLREAIQFTGFSVVDIWGVCPGRYLRRNRLTPKIIEEQLEAIPPMRGPVDRNVRLEYGAAYRDKAESLPPVSEPMRIDRIGDGPERKEHQIVFLGAAGQRIITAGELLGLAGLSAGLHVTQKNEYNITVLRGPSITDLILSPEPIHFTGITRPTTVLALAPEGVERREKMFASLDDECLVIRAQGVSIPPSRAELKEVDFRATGLNKADWALASLAWLAQMNRAIDSTMFNAALRARFGKSSLERALEVVAKVQQE